MKGIGYLLTGLILGIALGWASGFLRIPYLEKNFSFWLGFIAALALGSLLLILLAVWNGAFLSGLMGKKTVKETTQRAKTRIGIMLVGIVLLGGSATGLAVYRQIDSFKLQIQDRDRQLLKITALVESMRQQDEKPLLRSLLDDLADELKRSPRRTLLDTTIARIAALSFALRPYRYIQGDSLSEEAYSPERGQLLQALILLEPDSGSFTRIKQRTNFAGADLKGGDLKGLDLSGINLRQANLKDANLSGANLSGADFQEATLWGANLNRANLSHAAMKRANLSWAQLNEATLASTNLDGANLTNTQFLKSDLNHATIQYAKADGAMFNDADLTGVNFYSSNLTKVILGQANLSDADLRFINLSEADIAGAQLDKALVDDTWQEKLKKWQPRGAKDLLEKYAVKNDTFDKANSPLYRLRKN